MMRQSFMQAGRSGLTDSPEKGPIEAIIDLFIDSPPTIIRPPVKQACLHPGHRMLMQ